MLSSVARYARQSLRSNVAGRMFVLALTAGLLVLALVGGTSPPISTNAPSPPPHWSHEPIRPLLEAPALDQHKVALGKALFEDARLSGKGALPCSACHDVSTNGAGTSRGTTRTDTPTVFNVGSNFRLGWEGHDRTLEGQALATLEAPMIAQGVPLEAMLDRLRADPWLERRFRSIYGHAIDQNTVLDAIATYERSLVTPGSRFDRWLNGNVYAINAQERRGYARFKRLGCVSCHQGRNVGGNLLQRHGIFRPLAAAKPEVLRVPSLRNVATTAPYFHDGSAATLELAIVRMAGAQLDVDLSAREAADIAAFLNTLTGQYAGRPVHRPK